VTSQRKERTVTDTVNPRQNVSFASNGSHAHGYLALPASGSGPGLVVIQEWWGLTAHIADLTDRFAAEGFVALAPDLFGGRTTHDADEAGRLMTELPPAQASRDLAGAVDYLLSRDDATGDQVGLAGFCMGGAFVLNLAVQEGGKVAAAVAFYPVGQLPDDYMGLQADLLINYAEQDAFVPAESAAELAARIEAGSSRRPLIEWYPAGHAFLNDENLLGTYDPEQAQKAWDRAIEFLHQHLG
jgi:carboxymethylenebutenolidase